MNKKTAKILAFLIVSIFVMGLVATPVQAGAAVKLGRGITNVLTSPAEIVYQAKKMELEENGGHNAMVAWIAGVPKGLFWFPVRALQGVYSIVTFPLPWPDHYGSWLKPETMIEGMEEIGAGNA
jgi:putative exosortase-associated protein (TIGR04073 family)